MTYDSRHERPRAQNHRREEDRLVLLATLVGMMGGLAIALLILLLVAL